MIQNNLIQKLCVGLLCMSLFCITPCSAYAAPGTSQTSTQSPRRHLANIVFAGLAGAVLGLSTLSFYGRPQDRLSNIAVGFAIGVIGGTAYTTYKAAAAPRDFYGFDREPELWKVARESRPTEVGLDKASQLSWRFEF